MSVINIFIAISIVVVVTLFLYFLYQTKKLNNYRHYDYDIDPSEFLGNNSYKLICPKGYTYEKTNSQDEDICISDKNGYELKFKTLREKDENGEWSEFNYPDFETKEDMGRLSDRCEILNNENRKSVSNGCFTIQDINTCYNSKDGRIGSEFQNQDCVVVQPQDGVEERDKGSICQPEDWVVNQGSDKFKIINLEWDAIQPYCEYLDTN